MSEFSIMLEEFIKEKDVQISELARYCGIDRKNLFRLLQGKENLPEEDVVQKMSLFMKLTPFEHKYFYEKYVEKDSVKTLSQSALETLAIIAYNEPITRAQVDELRGINSSQMIRNLIAKDFVKELGKSTLPGRPNLYGITNQFLDYFGLSSKEDLPKLEDITTNEDDVDLYESRYKEVEVEEL